MQDLGEWLGSLNWTALGVIVSAGLSAVALILSSRANKTSKEGNRLANESNQKSDEANRISAEAAAAAKESNRIATEANALAEKEFHRRTEQKLIDWNLSWDAEGISVLAKNTGLNPAHEVVLTVYKKATTKAETIHKHSEPQTVQPGEVVALSIPEIFGHAAPPRPVKDIAGSLNGVSITDVIEKTLRDHGTQIPAGLDVGLVSSETLGIKFAEVHYSLRWKTPAGNADRIDARPMPVVWR